MLQKFEGGRGYVPQVTLRPNGEIALTKGVVIKYFAGKNYDVAELYYDDEAEAIAILPIEANGDKKEKLTEGAVTLRGDGKNSGALTLSGKTFCDRFGIDYSRKRIVSENGIFWDKEGERYGVSDLLVVSLEHAE